MAPSDPLVLIADDNAPLRKLGRCLLEKGGYTVETAQDGIETLDRIKQGGITLVLLDIWISDKTGLDVLDNLRGVKAPPRVIVLTSDTTSAPCSGRFTDEPTRTSTSPSNQTLCYPLLRVHCLYPPDCRSKSFPPSLTGSNWVKPRQSAPPLGGPVSSHIWSLMLDSYAAQIIESDLGRGLRCPFRRHRNGHSTDRCHPTQPDQSHPVGRGIPRFDNA